MKKINYLELDKKLTFFFYFSLLLIMIILSLFMILIAYDFKFFSFIYISFIAFIMPLILNFYRGTYKTKYWLPQYDLIMIPQAVIIFSIGTFICIISLFTFLMILFYKADLDILNYYILVFFGFILLIKIIIDSLLYKWSKNLIKPYIGTESKYFKVEINRLEKNITGIFNELDLDYNIDKSKNPMNQLLTLTIRFPKFKFYIECSEQNSSTNKSKITINDTEQQHFEIINKIKNELNNNVT